MPRYKVYMRGENYLLSLDGEHGKFGFSTARIVKAQSAEEAERIALIRTHQELNSKAYIVNSTPDAPRLKVEKLEQVGLFHFGRKAELQGFPFVSEESEAESIMAG